VHQEISVIAQNPLALVVAFHAGGQFAPRFQLLADSVDNCLILARVPARANHEIIGEAGDAGEVQNRDFGCLLFLRGAHCNAPPGLWLIV
jgi:hypothetical protein